MPVAAVTERIILPFFARPPYPDVFAIARMLEVFGPHKSLIQEFCGILQGTAISGPLFEVSHVNNALPGCKNHAGFKNKVEELLRSLPSVCDNACVLKAQPERLLFALLAHCWHPSEKRYCAVDKGDLQRDLCWHGQTPDLDKIAKVLEDQSFIVKSGDSWQPRVLFHLVMPEDWIRRKREQYTEPSR